MMIFDMAVNALLDLVTLVVVIAALLITCAALTPPRGPHL
jgi:hypothetical protein